MFGGYVSVGDGKSYLEYFYIIVRIVFFMEILKDGSDIFYWCLRLWYCFKKFYVYI